MAQETDQLKLERRVRRRVFDIDMFFDGTRQHIEIMKTLHIIAPSAALAGMRRAWLSQVRRS